MSYHISKSGMFTYENCPRRFRYGNLQKLEGDDPDQEPSKPLADGLYYHDCFAHAFEFEGPPSTDPSELYKQMFPGKEHDEILAKFVKKELDRLRLHGEECFKPLYVEGFFEDHEVLMKGYVDRIDRLSDGSIRVIDYKPRAQNIEIEVAFYAYLVEKCLGIKVDLCGTYGYRDGKWNVWPNNPEHIEEALSRSKAVLNVVSKAEERVSEIEDKYNTEALKIAHAYTRSDNEDDVALAIAELDIRKEEAIEHVYHELFRPCSDDCKWCDFPLRCLAESIAYDEDIV